MKLKTNCRLFGLYESLIGLGLLMADKYYIFNKISENNSIISKAIDYGLVGLVAVGSTIFLLDGLSDMITGMHHYGFTKLYQKFENKEEKVKTENWINQMRKSRENEIYLKDIFKSD